MEEYQREDIELISAGKDKEKTTCSRPYLVEPMAFLYNFGMFAFVSLNSEYIFHRVDDFATKTLNATIGREHPKGFTSDNLTNEDTNASVNTEDRDGWVSSTAADIVRKDSLSGGIIAILMSLIIVSYSDIKGRKIGLALPCLGGLLNSTCYFLVEWYQLSPLFIYIGPFMDGLCGQHMTLAGAGYAYLADVVKPHTRSFRYTLFSWSIFVAMAKASLAVGYMISSLGYLYTFALLLHRLSSVCDLSDTRINDWRQG